MEDHTTTAALLGAAIGAALAERDARIAELEAKVATLMEAHEVHLDLGRQLVERRLGRAPTPAEVARMAAGVPLSDLVRAA